ncbi:MAG: hypothetical protein MUF48_24490 [Pirellulaceae bacterium]|nr:hypothetical protein [Pirellulaceae bacterium]
MGSALQCMGIAWLLCAGAGPWDAVAAFDPRANPTSAWSYGYAAPGKQPFQLYNTAGVTSEGLTCWWTDNWTTVGGVLAKSPDAGPRVINGFQFAPGWLFLHPGPQDQKATLRFTAPASGAVMLAAHFAGTHSVTSTDVRVMHGDRVLFTADIRGVVDWERPERTPQATASCAHVVSLTAGETVDVQVGFGGDAHTCDYTAVRMIVTPLDSDLQAVTGAVRSLSGPLAGCRVDTQVVGQQIVVQTDAAGAFSLLLPRGKHVLRAAKSQHTPWQGELEVGDDSVPLSAITLPMTVDHSYAFAPPHRLTLSWPGASAKTLLDIHATHARISWTYRDLTEVALGAAPLPNADQFVDILPSLDGASFAQHRWERVDGGLPIALDHYETDGMKLVFSYIGGRDGMIARVVATNGTSSPRAVAVRCLDAGGGQALDWTSPDARGDALTCLRQQRLRLLTVGAPHHLRDADMAALLWQLEPGATREGYLVRPAQAGVDELAEYRQRDWAAAYDEAVAHWETLLGKAMRIELPDAGLQQAFYACLADLLTMQERASNGKLTQTTGSEVYRFSNAGDCAGGVVGLAQAGLLDNAREVFDTQLHLAQEDGNWAGGQFADFVAFSGLKAWVATVFDQLQRDPEFLADLYPYMLRSARWHAARRAQARRTGPDGRPIRGYGLIQPTMHDCGMNDATGTGVFIPHNTWAVYADKVALDVARRLGKVQDLAELEAIYHAGYEDLMATIRQSAIDEEGRRWIPSSPSDPSGSFWGALNTALPCRLLALDDPLVEGTIAKMESFESEGGLTKFTGWQKDGLWIAVVLDNLGMVYLARGEADYLNTWPEERNERPGTTTVTGDRQHIWTSGAFVMALRSALVVERGDELCIGMGMPREWLDSGRPVRVAGAPTAFGPISFELCYDRAAGAIEGSVTLAATCDARALRVYLRLPATITPDAGELPPGQRIEIEQPIAASAPACPVLVIEQPRGSLRFRIPTQ